MHGIRDFFLHLFTITVGLLIALGLEGCVERAHHRHLVHEAEASLRTEIQNNANAIPLALTELHKQQQSLEHDVEVLKYITQNHKAPADASMEINFRVHGLTDVAWKTAQSTGAVSYMPYAAVQEYADIYSTQDKFNATELQAVRDASVGLGPFLSGKKGDPDPPPERPTLSAKQSRSSQASSSTSTRSCSHLRLSTRNSSRAIPRSRFPCV